MEIPVESLLCPRRPLQESVTSEWDLHHDFTTSQLGLHELLREWRAEMDTYSREPGRYRYCKNFHPFIYS